MIDASQQLGIRRARTDDVAALVRLVNSGYRGDSSRAGWTTEADYLEGVRTDEQEVRALLQSEDALILLCCSENEIVGSVLLQREHTMAHLGMLVVKPTLQSQGIGKRLIGAAERAAVERWSVNTIRMSVITLRHELIAYYERRGYRRTGIFEPFPHHDLRSRPLQGELQFEILEKGVRENSRNPA